MAISSCPTPADAGVLCVILAHTAISISIFKEIVRSILHAVGIHIASWEELSEEPTDSAECHRKPAESYMEEFQSQIPSTRYGSVFKCKQECSICLTDFEPNAEINHLSCGHVFHRICLEKWLNYWNTTCPLCRNYMMPQEMEEEDTCPMYEEDVELWLWLGIIRVSNVSHITAEDFSPSSASFDPTDMPLRDIPEFLWYRHLKEPACVVGEHKQLCRLALDDFLRGTGDIGLEEDDRDGDILVSTYRSRTIIAGFSYFWLVFGSSAIGVLEKRLCDVS